MATAVLAVTAVGPMVTLQDRGRRALMRFGVPASGPMDPVAFAIAQAALGNAPAEAEATAIDVSLGGLTLDCREGRVSVAVAGGGFRVSLDGVAHQGWGVHALQAGSRLSLRPGAWGSWCTLAVAGRLQADRWLGSAATHALSGFGGGALSLGQTLVILDADHRPERSGAIPCPDWARPRRDLRVVLGPQQDSFAQDSIDALLGQAFVLGDAYDRMGVRLQGPSLTPQQGLSLPTQALLPGTIQVSGDGQATVLLADHQTTGGYPKIATLIGDDLAGFVQNRSGDSVRFGAVTPETAVTVARQGQRRLQTFLAQLSDPRRSLADRLASCNLIGGVVDAAHPEADDGD